MSDLNELSSPSKLPVRDTVRTAWQQVAGFKALAWGGTGFYILISVGISLVAGLIFGLLLGALGLPAENAAQPGFNPAFLASEAMRILLNLLITFFTAPLIVGQVMLAVRHLRQTPETNVYCLFNYFKWRFMWRFFMINIILFFLVFSCIFVGALLFSAGTLLPQHIAIVSHILLGLAIAGLIVFFLVLIYLAISLQFSQLLIGDKNFQVLASVSTALRVVRQNFWRIIAVFLLCALILLPIVLAFTAVTLGFEAIHLHWLGLLIDAIGVAVLLIWLLPWSLLINGAVYKNLFERENP